MSKPISVKKYSQRHRNADVYETKNFRERIHTQSQEITIFVQSKSNFRAVTFGGIYSVLEADESGHVGAQKDTFQQISRKTVPTGGSLTLNLGAKFISRKNYYIWEIELHLIGLFSGTIEDWLDIQIG